MRHGGGGEISFGQFDARVQGWINHAEQADTWGLRRHVLRGLPLAGLSLKKQRLPKNWQRAARVRASQQPTAEKQFPEIRVREWGSTRHGSPGRCCGCQARPRRDKTRGNSRNGGSKSRRAPPAAHLPGDAAAEAASRGWA